MRPPKIDKLLRYFRKLKHTDTAAATAQNLPENADVVIIGNFFSFFLMRSGNMSLPSLSRKLVSKIKANFSINLKRMQQVLSVN